MSWIYINFNQKFNQGWLVLTIFYHTNTVTATAYYSIFAFGFYLNLNTIILEIYIRVDISIRQIEHSFVSFENEILVF